jgi:SAM-dependent MidA family methyltransferase
MTSVGEILAGEIGRGGPISFRRFMDVALYHPEHGYYRRAHRRGDGLAASCVPASGDPFGREGDFFTAEQIQPVFGILMAARVRQLFREMGEPKDFAVLELGAGRGEMAASFSEWRYLPIEIGDPLPGSFRGVVFSNEFFDALPVEAAIFQGGAFRQQLVGLDQERFVWQTGDAVNPETEQYLRRFFPPPEDGRWYETNLEALQWIDRIAETLTEGYVLTIDYGFTRAESVRFPTGTLMGYHRHTALENVLDHPGRRDITAHVNFSALQERSEECGLHTKFFGTLAQTLLDAGEDDQFAAALAGPDEFRRRMQLKTLLFGMGETFRVLLQKKE